MSFNIKVKKATGNLCDTCQSSRHFKPTDKQVSLSRQGVKYSCVKDKAIINNDGIKKPCHFYSLKFSIKSNLALRTIKYQFPSTPEGNLMFSIISQAVHDLKDNKYKKSSLRFLSGEMPQAELCGVESKWITNVLSKCHVI